MVGVRVSYNGKSLRNEVSVGELLVYLPLITLGSRFLSLSSYSRFVMLWFCTLQCLTPSPSPSFPIYSLPLVD